MSHRSQDAARSRRGGSVGAPITCEPLAVVARNSSVPLMSCASTSALTRPTIEPPPGARRVEAVEGFRDRAHFLAMARKL